MLQFSGQSRAFPLLYSIYALLGKALEHEVPYLRCISPVANSVWECFCRGLSHCIKRRVWRVFLLIFLRKEIACIQSNLAAPGAGARHLTPHLHVLLLQPVCLALCCWPALNDHCWQILHLSYSEPSSLHEASASSPSPMDASQCSLRLVSADSFLRRHRLRHCLSFELSCWRQWSCTPTMCTSLTCMHMNILAVKQAGE